MKPPSNISSDQWIEMYEQSRPKAGQAQKAKQGAASADKPSARRAGAKRRP